MVTPFPKGEAARNPYRQAIEQAGCIIDGAFLLNSGEATDTKIECDKLFEPGNVGMLMAVLGGLRQVVRELQADALTGVPRGGNRLADALAWQTGLPHLEAERLVDVNEDGEPVKIRRLTKESCLQLPGYKRLVVIEDVTTTNSSLNDFLGHLEEEGADIAGSGVVWRRGRPIEDGGQEQPVITGEVHYLVEEFIPVQPANER